MSFDRSDHRITKTDRDCVQQWIAKCDASTLTALLPKIVATTKASWRGKDKHISAAHSHFDDVLHAHFDNQRRLDREKENRDQKLADRTQQQLETDAANLIQQEWEPKWREAPEDRKEQVRQEFRPEQRRFPQLEYWCIEEFAKQNGVTKETIIEQLTAAAE